MAFLAAIHVSSVLSIIKLVAAFDLLRFDSIESPILSYSIFTASHTEAGVTFDNSFFNNSFVFLRQCKDRSFLGTFTVHKKVEIRINQSKTGQHLTSINVFFDFFPTLYWSKKTLNEVKCCPVLLRLILISTSNFLG